MSTPSLFQTVPSKNYFFESLVKPEEFQKVARFFEFKKEDVAKAADVPPTSVRSVSGRQWLISWLSSMTATWIGLFNGLECRTRCLDTCRQKT
jgi:hypothetical protein